MAVEKNPNDSTESKNIIDFNATKEQLSDNVNIEIDPETGEMEIEFQPEIELSDVDNIIQFEDYTDNNFYENLADLLDEDVLSDIGHEVYEKFEADKNSRSEWESMFERGFDLLGLKLEETTEPL